MKKIIVLLLVMCGVGYAQQNMGLDSAIQSAGTRIQNDLRQGTRVAVLNFASSSEQFSSYVIEKLLDILTNGKKLSVIDRQRLELIRGEMNFQLSGDVRDESIISIGHILGVQSIISGSIVNTGTSYRFRLYAINIETAAREASSSLNLNINDQQVNFLLRSETPVGSILDGIWVNVGELDIPGPDNYIITIKGAEVILETFDSGIERFAKGIIRIDGSHIFAWPTHLWWFPNDVDTDKQWVPIDSYMREGDGNYYPDDFRFTATVSGNTMIARWVTKLWVLKIYLLLIYDGNK
jgi:hypothetical protein